MAKKYLDHHFPVILHTAAPAMLEKEMKNKLNDFLPILRESFKKVVFSKGRKHTDYKLLKPHHMAIAMLPEKFIIALDTNNATLFMTSFFYFELEKDVGIKTIERILEDRFFLTDCNYYEFEKCLIEGDIQKKHDLIYKKAVEYEERDYNLIKKEKGSMEVFPKIFSNKKIELRSNYCFVLMPFKDELQEIYEDCIKKAIEDLDMFCERADDIFHNKSIMEVIWTQICSSEIIIADLTGKNPNVFYEVGIAHAIGKEVILITQDEQDVPFDLRHLRYIRYQVTKRGQEQLIDDLKITIKSIKDEINELSEHQ